MVTSTQNASGPTLAVRSRATRKLLARKAITTAEMPSGEPLEASFPGYTAEAAPGLEGSSSALADILADDAISVAASAPRRPNTPMAREPSTASVGALPPLVAQVPALAGPWSDEDESTFQALLAKRKAARVTGPRLVADRQIISLGKITPNPDTVVAVIVGIVAVHGGSIARGRLAEAMAAASFAHPRAQPSDRGWCAGYIAGGIRNRFLAVAEPAAAK